LFRLGSISKTFTWIAAMKEVEAGRMQLDAPINTYLPADLAIPAVSGWRSVELRDLMSHTPGFEERVLDHMFAETAAQVRPLAEELKRFPVRRVFPPGTTPAYSNFGVMLTGEAVSRLEGASFQDVIEREITEPLGMAHTTFREPYPKRADLPAPLAPGIAADLSAAFHASEIELKAEPFEWLTQVAPAGGASSTAGDMARYMLMILGDGELNGVRIYSPSTASAFRTPIRTAVPNGADVDHGFLQTPLPGGFTGYGHDGDTLWFHSNLVTVPALGLGIFVSTNTDSGQPLVLGLPQLIVGHFYAPPAGPARGGVPSLNRSDAIRYAGTYAPNRRAFSGLEKFLWLMIGQSSIYVTSDGYLVTQNEGKPKAWVPDGRSGHFLAADGPQSLDFAIRGREAVTWYDAEAAVSFDRVGPIYQRNVLLLMALLTATAAAATLIASGTRARKSSAATRLQRQVNLAQLLAAGAWLIALGATAAFFAGADDKAGLVFAWPDVRLVIASSAALCAALLSIVVLTALPFTWKSHEGWGTWRKLRFSASGILFAAFGVQLAFWGFLQPWAA
jgi:CubicO group peptidase (beta-lactamase class C family)